jgi:hypothetical protein
MSTGELRFERFPEMLSNRREPLLDLTREVFDLYGVGPGTSVFATTAVSSACLLHLSRLQQTGDQGVSVLFVLAITLTHGLKQ